MLLGHVSFKSTRLGKMDSTLLTRETFSTKMSVVEVGVLRSLRFVDFSTHFTRELFLDLVQICLVKFKQNVKSVFLLWTIVVMCLFLNWAPSRVCFLCDCKGRCTFQKPFRNVRKDSSSVPGASCCSGRHIFFSRQKFFHIQDQGTCGS